MHPQSTVMDATTRARILSRERGALPEQPTTQAWGALSWARVSKSVQDTIDAQQGAIAKLAKLYGVPIVRERHAEGSRWNHTSEAWSALQEDIESRQFSHLLLFKADRLAGDDLEMVGLVRKALRAGMKVIDTIVGTIDDNNVGMLGMMSYMDIKNTSVRTMLKLDALPELGVKVGGVPYGYRPQCMLHPCKCGLHGRHVPDEVRKDHVIGLFERYGRGDTLDSCRRWFNEVSGLRCGDWAIKRMLRNQYYVGVIVGRKQRHSQVMGRYGRPKEDWTVSEHEYPIIDGRLFDRVQARLESHSTVGQHRSTKPRHPMTGLVWCVRCNRRMKFHAVRANSEVWACPHCNVSRGTKKLERAVVGMLRAIPFPSEQAARDATRSMEGQEQEVRRQIVEIDAQLDKLTARRRNWADLVGDGDMTRAEYRERIADNDKAREHLRQEREAVSGRLAALPGYQDVGAEVLAALAAMGDWTHALIGSSEDDRRTLYTTLLAKVAMDVDANVVTVVYSPALASWCGRASDSVLW